MDWFQLNQAIKFGVGVGAIAFVVIWTLFLKWLGKMEERKKRKEQRGEEE